MNALFTNGYYDILSEIFQYLSYLEIKNLCLINKTISHSIKNKNSLIDSHITQKKTSDILEAEHQIQKLRSIRFCFSSTSDIDHFLKRDDIIGCYHHLIDHSLKYNDIKSIELLIQIDPSELKDVDQAIKRVKNGYVIDTTLYARNNVTLPIFGDILLWAVQKNQNKLIKKLVIDPRVDVNHEGGEILFTAIKSQNIQTIKILLENNRTYRKTVIHRAINIAKDLRNEAILNLLYKADRIEYYTGQAALLEAIRLGNIDIFNILINRPEIDPSIENNQAIISASYAGNLEMVNRLLVDPRVNPSAKNNLAIKFADDQKHLSVMKRLLDDVRVKNTLPKERYQQYLKSINS